jgi:hypothetical protein
MGGCLVLQHQRALLNFHAIKMLPTPPDNTVALFTAVVL